MSGADLLAKVLELEHRSHQLMRQYSLDAWMGLNLTVPQLKSLFFIANHQDTSPGKLAVALGVTPANVTGIIDRLVEQGLVFRKENPNDRRALALRVTEKGEALLANLRERRTNRMLEILSRMSAEELSCLARGLASLVEIAEIMDREKWQNNQQLK
jgi:DNA-binding MarR family transcriptional regulator